MRLVASLDKLGDHCRGGGGGEGEREKEERLYRRASVGKRGERVVVQVS